MSKTNQNSLALSLLNEIDKNKNEVFVDTPNILILDWNDCKVLKFYWKDIADLAVYNALNNDLSIREKLKKTKRLQSLLKWSINYDELLNACEKLVEKQKGVFSEDHLFYYPIAWMQIKFYHHLVNETMKCENNNEPTLQAKLTKIFKSRKRYPDIIHKNKSDIKRIFLTMLKVKVDKDKKHFSQLTKRKTDPIDFFVVNLLHIYITIYQHHFNRKNAMKNIIGLLCGDFSTYIRNIQIDKKSIKKTNQFHRDFFEYLLIVGKDQNFYKTKSEFDKMDLGTYDGNYDKYIISRSKVILGLTK
jgi:hypothetical protein